MDKLDVIHEFEERGGEARKVALEEIMIAARRAGCDIQIGKGKVGGINIRYGGRGFTIMDVDAEGQVKIYVRTSRKKTGPREEIRDKLNKYVEEDDNLEPTRFPIGTYAYLDKAVEDVPRDAIIGFIEKSVDSVREVYYR